MTDTNQKLREALQKAKDALSLALSDVDWRKDSPTQPVIHKAYNCAQQALALPTDDVRSILQDAQRYRWLREQNNDDFAFAVVKDPHFDVYESPEELDSAIDAAMRKGRS